MQTRKPTIVVALINDSQSYQRGQAEAARTVAASADVNLEVIFADSNPRIQVQQLLRYANAPEDERPFALVVEPMTADGLDSVARQVVAAGIGWILLHSPPYIERLSAEFPSIPVAYAVANNLQIGAIQAQQARMLLPNGGRILCIEGARDNAATIDRLRGLQEGLRDSNIEVAERVPGSWKQTQSAQMVAFWLRFPHASPPDLVAAQNDSMAVGARETILSKRPDWSPLYIGVDGLPEEGERLVAEGILAATVVLPNTAGRGMELALRALRGEHIASVTVPVRSLPPIEALKSVRLTA